MGTLAVDNIQHTDGSSAVTLNNAGITNLSAGTIGSGVTFPTGHVVKQSIWSDAVTTSITASTSSYVDTGIEVAHTTALSSVDSERLSISH